MRISGPTHAVLRFIVNSYFFSRLVLGWFLKLGTQRLVAHPSKLIFHDRSDMRHFILSNLLYLSQCRCRGLLLHFIAFSERHTLGRICQDE